MTKRLYDTDAYPTEFESQVTRCTPAAGRFEVSLAATAFYPMGGGHRAHRRWTAGAGRSGDVAEMVKAARDILGM